jgi:tripartite-type tricarboxylate transporter receptor subunit TctC
MIKSLVVAAAIYPAAASAQTYPSRPIVMVVPFAAGGSFDVMGRIMSARMSELLGQQVVVENTPGAGGIVGVNRVASAARRLHAIARHQRHPRLQSDHLQEAPL